MCLSSDITLFLYELTVISKFYVIPEYNFHSPEKNCIVKGPKNKTAVKNKGNVEAAKKPGILKPICSYTSPLLRVVSVKKYWQKNGASSIMHETLKNLFFIVEG